MTNPSYYIDKISTHRSNDKKSITCIPAVPTCPDMFAATGWLTIGWGWPYPTGCAAGGGYPWGWGYGGG